MEKLITREQKIDTIRVSFKTTPVYEAAAKFVAEKCDLTYSEYMKKVITNRPSNHNLSLSHYIRVVITRDTLNLAQQGETIPGLPV